MFTGVAENLHHQVRCPVDHIGLLGEIRIRIDEARKFHDAFDAIEISAAGRADLCAVARPHLANPAWTLTEAARIGFKDIAWPRAYESGKSQLEAGFARERAMQTASKGD